MVWESRPYEGPRGGIVDEDLLNVTIEDWDTETYDYEPVIDRDDLQLRSPRFELPNNLEPTAETMCEMYWTDDVLDDIVQCSNDYAKDHVSASQYKPVNRAEILRFMAILTYMGVVKLPAKTDYWPSVDDDWWPTHPAIRLKKTRFLYIWRTFHTAYRPADRMPQAEEEEEEFSDAEEDIFEDAVDSDVDVEGDSSDSSSDEGDPDDDYNRLGEDYEHKWYTAMKKLLIHINAVSKNICKIPGAILSLDEMLRLFKGRSANTERMARKPDKEGFKFFALCDLATAFVYDFFPCGRLFKRKTSDHVKTLLKTLPSPQTIDYVVCMDNFFTHPDTMKACRDMGIGAFGTARRWRHWSPMRDVDDDTFNTVYLEHDKNNYLISRWIDNAEVLFVSNIHSGYGVVDSYRRRPRENQKNSAHIRKVFGTDGAKTMEIPEIVNDYNHWMNGVDLADQLISTFKPKFRCCRTWVPLFLQAADIARTNSYVVCRFKETTKSHKQFVMDWISSLNDRATAFERGGRATRRRAAEEEAAVMPSSAKKPRQSHVFPEMEAKRLMGDATDHVLTMGDKQAVCRYCAYLVAKAKAEGDDNIPPKRRPKWKCDFCGVHLCKEGCFGLYHCRPD